MRQEVICDTYSSSDPDPDEAFLDAINSVARPSFSKGHATLKLQAVEVPSRRKTGAIAAAIHQTQLGMSRDYTPFKMSQPETSLFP